MTLTKNIQTKFPLDREGPKMLLFLEIVIFLKLVKEIGEALMGMVIC